EMLKNGARFHSDIWAYARQSQKLTWQLVLQNRVALNFQKLIVPAGSFQATSRPLWSPGRYSVLDQGAVIFTGSPENKIIDLPPLKLTDIDNPFVSLILVSQDNKPIAESSKLLLAIVGRGGNKNMGWNERRKSIADQWGSAPPQ